MNSTWLLRLKSDEALSVYPSRLKRLGRTETPSCQKSQFPPRRRNRAGATHGSKEIT